MAATLNEQALAVAEALAARADELRIKVHRTAGGATILDCGIEAPGGLHAGLGMARVCLAGRAEVSLAPDFLPDVPSPQVQVASDDPVRACMAAQYAGWQISVGKFFAMGSGPMRALWGKEELFQDIPGKEQAAVAVGVLETRKLPPDDVVAYLAQQVQLPPAQLTLLAAPAASIAGTLQVVARSLETALHKLHTLKFDLTKVVSGYGVAPLPPVGLDELKAIGHTNDAILYGGRAVLWVRAEDAEIAGLGPRVPSSASPDFGAPFATIFERAGRDFYKIDPMLFSPAAVVFHNLQTGKSSRFGRPEPDLIRRSFGDLG